MLLVSAAVIDGLIWSALWALFLLPMMLFFPWLMMHDLPQDIQQAARLPKQTAAQNRNGNLWMALGWVVLLGTLIAAGLFRYAAAPVSFGVLFLHLWIICMMWNVVDLLIMDWLIFCAITPKCFVLPGTQGCKGYKNYKYHFIGFLKGCVYMTLFALVFGTIDFAILKFFIW